MKNIRKITLFIILLLATFISPILSNATTKEISTEEALRQAIDDAKDGDVIELTTNIVLTSPLEIRNKTITIDGKGNSISRTTDNWEPNGANGSLITAGLPGTKLTLMNMTLKDAQKYGAQSYDGAYLILDNVTFTNNSYGAVLVNSGSLEVKNITLNRNGGESNNGIEIAKGDGVYTDGTRPELIMNGTLTSTENEYVIHIDIVNPSNGFGIINTENSKNKVFLSDGKLVVTDENNEILYTSDEVGDVTVTGETYIENITVTVKLSDKTAEVRIQKGTKLTKEDLITKINLASLELEDYTIDAFYTDADLTKDFDFETAISEDTIIYAKLSKTNSPADSIDETPKTGATSGFTIVTTIFTVSIIALATLKRNKK